MFVNLDIKQKRKCVLQKKKTIKICVKIAN